MSTVERDVEQAPRRDRTPAQVVEMRLPRIVLAAAWWVRFTCIAGWAVLWIAATWVLFQGLMWQQLGGRMR